jgi:hypothetical protein
VDEVDVPGGALRAIVVAVGGFVALFLRFGGIVVRPILGLGTSNPLAHMAMRVLEPAGNRSHRVEHGIETHTYECR